MKASSVLYFILIVAGFMTIFALFANDMNTQYDDPGTHRVNISAWEGKYNYSDTVNGSVGRLKSNFDTITDTDKSWFTKIGAGIVAIPYAVILYPLAIFDGLSSFGNILTSMASAIGVPPPLIYIGLIFLVVFAVNKMLEFFQRSPA